MRHHLSLNLSPAEHAMLQAVAMVRGRPLLGALRAIIEEEYERVAEGKGWAQNGGAYAARASGAGMPGGATGGTR